jgi:hypothetical protein
MGSSWPGVGGLEHPWETKLSLLPACLKFQAGIFQKILFEVAEGGQSIFSICFEQKRGSRPYLQGKIVSWGSFGV